MFTASILFFVIKTIFYQSPWCRRYLNKPFKYFLWNIYVGILGLISISRMFFACHFFHQCVFGSCFGITISHILQKPKVNRFLTELGRIKAFMLGMAIVIFSISIYFAHYVIAQDPLWTVKKVVIWFAFKHKKTKAIYPVNIISLVFSSQIRLSIGAKIHIISNQKPVQFIRWLVNLDLCLD